MIIAKIKNRYMYHSKDGKPNGSHTYIIYYDKVTKKNHAIATTHLYTPDKRRMVQVKYGIYKKMKLPNYETPSGVYHKSVNKNVYGTDINLRSKDVKITGYLPHNQSKKVLQFINKKQK